MENSLAYLIYDKFPVTPMHCLIIPKRHFASYFEISQSETNAVNRLVLDAQKLIRYKDSKVNAFNIGINAGEAAGQTIFHTHIHLIPRRVHDVDEAVGGVRNIIPGRGRYSRG